MSEASDSKYVTKKCNIVNDNSKSNYDRINEITYNKEAFKSNFGGCNDAYTLVRDDINVKAALTTQVLSKNCVPFTKCITKKDEIKVDDAENLDLLDS